MADICVVYLSEDEPIVGRLVASLRKEWSVWWAQDLAHGDCDHRKWAPNPDSDGASAGIEASRKDAPTAGLRLLALISRNTSRTPRGGYVAAAFGARRSPSVGI